MAFEEFKKLGKYITGLIWGNEPDEETTTPETQVGDTTDETTTQDDTGGNTGDEPVIKRKVPTEEGVNETVIKALTERQRIKDTLVEPDTPTFDELFPSMKTDINRGTVSGDNLSMPIYAASLLYPYALLDKRVNAQLRQAKIKELYADRIDLKAPETFYRYQPVLSNNFYKDVTGLLASEKAKGGNWFDRAKDPNGALMTKVREYREFATEMKDYAVMGAELEKKMASEKADQYYMSPESSEAIHNFLYGYGKFAENPEDLPIEAVRELGGKFNIAINYNYMLDNTYKDVLKENGDVSTYFGQASKDLAADPSINRSDYNQITWDNMVAAKVTQTYLSPDRAKGMAENYMTSYPDMISSQLNDGKPLPSVGTPEWNVIQDKVQEDIIHLVGSKVKADIEKITTKETAEGKARGARSGVVVDVTSQPDVDIVTGNKVKKWNLIGMNPAKPETNIKTSVATGTKGDYIITFDDGTTAVRTGQPIPAAANYDINSYQEGTSATGYIGGDIYISNPDLDKYISSQPAFKGIMPEGKTIQKIVIKAPYDVGKSAIESSGVPLVGASNEAVTPEYPKTGGKKKDWSKYKR